MLEVFGAPDELMYTTLEEAEVELLNSYTLSGMLIVFLKFGIGGSAILSLIISLFV